MRRGAGEIGAAIAAGGEDRHVGARKRWIVPSSILSATTPRQRPSSSMIRSMAKILDEELGGVAQRLPVQRVQHGVAGAVGGGAGALRGALAVMGRHAAERALVDLAVVLAARERHAPVLELVDRRRRVAAQVFDGVLVAEPVGALDGVVHVPAPVVLAHVAERGGDAALRRDRVRAGRKHLGDAGGAQARLAAADHGAQAGAAGADHDHVVGVILDRIGAAVGGRIAGVPLVATGQTSKLSLRMAKADGEPDRDGEERVRHEQGELRRLVVHVVLDDDLHADAHVDGDRQDEQQHEHGDQRRAEDLHHRGMIATEQAHHDEHEADGQRHVGDGGQALAPEMLGAGFGRARGRARARAGCSSCPQPSARPPHEQVAHDPDHDGEADRADQGRHASATPARAARSRARYPRSDA